MGAKRKLYFSLLCIGLVVVMLVATTSLALSALYTNVDSGFSVSYAGKNINAAVAGSYNLSGTEKNMTVSGQEGLLTFNDAQSAGGGILTL